MTFKANEETQLDHDIFFTIVTVVKDDLIGLQKTRKSLENQNYRKWQHIVIDGDSGQETQRFLRSLPTLNTIHVSESDSGIYEAMNKAWKLADPRSFVFYLNAADVFTDSNSLSNANIALKRQPLSNWGCTTHEEIQEDGDGWVCKLVSPPSINNQLYAFGYRSHQAVVMKADFISQLGGFDESYLIAADWDLIVKAMLRENPVVWMEPLACFQRGGFSEDKLLAAHLELKSLRRKYISLSFIQKLFEKVWMAIYLRNFGYRNLFSPLINYIFPTAKLAHKNKFPKKRRLRSQLKAAAAHKALRILNSKLLISDYSPTSSL